MTETQTQADVPQQQPSAQEEIDLTAVLPQTEIKSHQFQNGCHYQGEWVSNKRHGYGVYTWPSGAKYEGEYQYDKRHGNGKLRYADQSEYDGQWSYDLREGMGKFTWPDGSTYTGTFIND